MKFDLVHYINWDVVLDEGNWYSGSHIGFYSAIFHHTQAIAEYCTDDYQGTDAMIFIFAPPDPDVPAKLILLSDSYGSCSYCDAWGEADEATARELAENLARNVNMFDTLEELREFLEVDVKNEAGYYSYREVASGLLKNLDEFIEEQNEDK